MATQHVNTFFVYALAVHSLRHITIYGAGVYAKVVTATLLVLGSFDLFMDTLYHAHADLITLSFRFTSALLQPALALVEFQALLLTLNSDKRQSLGYQVAGMSIEMTVSISSALVHYYYCLPKCNQIRQQVKAAMQYHWQRLCKFFVVKIAILVLRTVSS